MVGNTSADEGEWRVKLQADRLTIRQPDDWHVHLRDGAMLEAVLMCTARIFGRAIVMPNLMPPLMTVEATIEYRRRILRSLPQDCGFTPLMTAYLSDGLHCDVLERGQREGVFTAAKLYPAHATTNSEAGVSDLHAIDSVLETMQRIGMPLLIHGEVTDPDVDIFDREAVFIERHLEPLLSRYPELRVVLEHITTEDAVQFVNSAGKNLAATITPHHLHINRNAIFLGGLRSDFYCLPVVKRERHRLALRRAATSGSPSFFLGTDSAPHPRGAKENACGCAGIFNAPYALESYAAVFEEEGALDRFESFASEFGPAFYGLPLNASTITLEKRAHRIPQHVAGPCLGASVEKLVPFHAGETLNWCVV